MHYAVVDNIHKYKPETVTVKTLFTTTTCMQNNVNVNKCLCTTFKE